MSRENGSFNPESDKTQPTEDVTRKQLSDLQEWEKESGSSRARRIAESMAMENILGRLVGNTAGLNLAVDVIKSHILNPDDPEAGEYGSKLERLINLKQQYKEALEACTALEEKLSRQTPPPEDWSPYSDEELEPEKRQQYRLYKKDRKDLIEVWVKTVSLPEQFIGELEKILNEEDRKNKQSIS